MSLKVTNKTKQFEQQIKRKAKLFVNAVLSSAGAISTNYAPIAYGALRNSQYSKVMTGEYKITGELGYTVNYAAALNNNKNWKPKPPPKYGNKKRGIPSAPAWNANATPQFLNKGFESREARESISDLAREILGSK